MNFYKRHLGDIAKATAHLSQGEMGAYDLLLDWVYSNEKPLPLRMIDVCRIARGYSRVEKFNIERVLLEFFDKTPSGYTQKRALKELAKANAQAEINQKIALEREARKRARMEHESCTNGQPSQTPDTRHHKEQEQKQKGGKPPALTLPDWLPESAWSDWHAFRNSRKGWTHKARELSLATLTKLYSKGHDPTAVIEKSIEMGWTGLFGIKSENQHANIQPSRRLSVVERIQQAIDTRKSNEADDIEGSFTQINA